MVAGKPDNNHYNHFSFELTTRRKVVVFVFKNVSALTRNLLLSVVSPRHHRFADMLIGNDEDAGQLISLFESCEELPALLQLRRQQIGKQELTLDQFASLWMDSPAKALEQLFLFPLIKDDFPILHYSMQHRNMTIKDVFDRHQANPALSPWRIIPVIVDVVRHCR